MSLNKISNLLVHKTKLTYLIIIWGLWVFPICIYASPLSTAGPYSYRADKTPLSKILKDFANNFGVSLSAESEATKKILEKTLSGQTRGTSPINFLDNITSSYGLLWFYYAGKIYIMSQSDWLVESINIPSENINDFQQTLTDIELINDKFKLSFIKEQGVVLVSAPREYIQVIKKIALNMGGALPKQKIIKVFKLKYASAEDRTIQSRNQTTIIPGLITILRNLVSSTNKQAAPNKTTVNNQEKNNGLDEMKNIDSPQKTKPSGNISLEASQDFNIEADSRNNAIIIRDTPQQMKMYEQLISELDKETSIIEISAIIVDISSNSLSELGVDWTAGFGSSTLSKGTRTTTTDTNTISLATGVYPGTTTVLANRAFNFLSQLRILESNGNAKIVGTPSILTVDNLGALIDLSTTFYANVSGERTASLVPVTTGTMLRVTPYLIRNDDKDEIRLTIDIEDGSLVDRAGLSYPLVSKSTIATEAVIRSDESLLIGGYKHLKRTNGKSGVPILGDIPYIGTLFSNKADKSEYQERLFLLSPRIIRSPRIDNKNLTKNEIKPTSSTTNNIDLSQFSTEKIYGNLPDSLRLITIPAEITNSTLANKSPSEVQKKKILMSSHKFLKTSLLLK